VAGTPYWTIWSGDTRHASASLIEALVTNTIERLPNPRQSV